MIASRQSVKELDLAGQGTSNLSSGYRGGIARGRYYYSIKLWGTYAGRGQECAPGACDASSTIDTSKYLDRGGVPKGSKIKTRYVDRGGGCRQGLDGHVHMVVWSKRDINIRAFGPNVTVCKSAMFRNPALHIVCRWWFAFYAVTSYGSRVLMGFVTSYGMPRLNPGARSSRSIAKRGCWH